VIIFDPLYLVFMIPALVLSLVAQMWVKSAMKKYSRVPARSGVTGAHVAREILRRDGIDNVKIERVSGWLSDHYDPRSRTLRLSPDNYDGRSVAALGVAAHEAGHAIQHARNYTPLLLRQTMAPLAMFGSNFAFFFIIGGFILGMAGLVHVGIILFAAGVAFSLITLPVEFNASARAKHLLPQLGFIQRGDEMTGVIRVLNAAALTYLAAALAALLQLLYFLYRAGLLGGRN